MSTVTLNHPALVVLLSGGRYSRGIEGAREAEGDWSVKLQWFQPENPSVFWVGFFIFLMVAMVGAFIWLARRNRREESERLRRHQDEFQAEAARLKLDDAQAATLLRWTHEVHVRPPIRVFRHAASMETTLKHAVQTAVNTPGDETARERAVAALAGLFHLLGYQAPGYHRGVSRTSELAPGALVDVERTVLGEARVGRFEVEVAQPKLALRVLGDPSVVAFFEPGQAVTLSFHSGDSTFLWTLVVEARRENRLILPEGRGAKRHFSEIRLEKHGMTLTATPGSTARQTGADILKRIRETKKVATDA